jgi:hypothetical protein
MMVLTFDLAAMPPTPGFVVSASPDGTTFTQATQVSVNGYRLTAWFPPMEMLYISLAITPAAPDTLGGSSYTFGLTDFAGVETEFQLMSELVTLPIMFSPVGSLVSLVAPQAAGLLYFLSFNGGTWQEYVNGSAVTLPGTSSSSTSSVTMNSGGVLSIELPLNVYEASIQVIDQATGLLVNVAPGLAPGGLRMD